MSQSKAPMTEFGVLNCFGEAYGTVSVPFTGDLRADSDAAYAEMTAKFEPWTCGQCGDYGPSLGDEPLNNVELYPPKRCTCCQELATECICIEACNTCEEGKCAAKQ